MSRISFSIGMGILSVLEKNNITVEEGARKTGYSFRDFRRIIEGKLFLSPRALDDLSSKLGTTSKFLIEFKPSNNRLLPGLEYNKEFSSEEHLYKIIDLLDEYIQLKEQM